VAVSCFFLNTCYSGALRHLSGGTIEGTWTTLLKTISLLSEFHLRISQTESATANRHILSISIQVMKTQSLPKYVPVIRGDVTFSCCSKYLERRWSLACWRVYWVLNYCVFCKGTVPFRVSRTDCQLTNSGTLLKTPNQSWSVL
jgi:hypothetical protein